MGEAGQDDTRTAARRARADTYFNEHLNKQRQWYGKNASSNKKWAQTLSFCVILAGGLTTFLQIFSADSPAAGGRSWTVILTGVLALSIVAAEGLSRIGRFQESWVAYRKASEQMKREYRLYINGAGGYEQITDEEAAYRAFVANVEQIIAEEQQLYWQSFGKDGGQESKPE